jgi:hypothetical protein
MKELTTGLVVRVRGESPSEFFRVCCVLESKSTGAPSVRLLSYKTGAFKHVRPDRIRRVRNVPPTLQMPSTKPDRTEPKPKARKAHKLTSAVMA